ncbi:putative plant SNARE 12 [Bienertia sinuspersici]
MALEATQAMDPLVRRDNGHNGEATSKAKQSGRGGGGGKGKVQKLHTIGDNARHFVNECGRVVITRAPLNVKNWKEAFIITGDAMWKEIEGKFEMKEGGSYMKLQAFAVDIVQRLYRLWKARLHYYNETLGDQWQHCVERIGSTEFKKISERNSKNRLSEKRTKTITGNLSFAEIEVILTQENHGVKPPVDLICLVEHTTRNNEGVLQEDPLDVLKPRSGYFRGKGTALRGYSKGRMQLEHQNLINEQQKQIQVQEQRIKDYKKLRKKIAKQLQEAEERTSKQLEQQREDMQHSMVEMRQHY